MALAVEGAVILAAVCSNRCPNVSWSAVERTIDVQNTIVEDNIGSQDGFGAVAAIVNLIGKPVELSCVANGVVTNIVAAQAKSVGHSCVGNVGCLHIVAAEGALTKGVEYVLNIVNRAVAKCRVARTRSVNNAVGVVKYGQRVGNRIDILIPVESTSACVAVKTEGHLAACKIGCCGSYATASVC